VRVTQASNAAAAEPITVASIETAVAAPVFTESVSSSLTSAGVSATIQAVSAPIRTTIVILAPDPPPPGEPPSPPPPVAPAIALTSSNAALGAAATGDGATPDADSSLVTSLVLGTICVIVLIVCFPVVTIALVYWVRKHRNARRQQEKDTTFVSVVAVMADAETQCSDAGDDDDFGAGVLGANTPMPGITESGSRDRIAPPTMANRDRIAAPFASPRGDVKLTL